MPYECGSKDSKHTEAANSCQDVATAYEAWTKSALSFGDMRSLAKRWLMHNQVVCLCVLVRVQCACKVEIAAWCQLM